MEGFKKLKSGARVPSAVVSAVMSDLTRLFCTDPLTVRCLISKAFAPLSRIDDSARAKLSRLRYLDAGGLVPEDARQVIISSVTSLDDMHIGNPLDC